MKRRCLGQNNVFGFAGNGNLVIRKYKFYLKSKNQNKPNNRKMSVLKKITLIRKL